MAKENFTAGRIAAFKCAEGKKQSIYWDAKVPGLGLRVTSTGNKAYIFETRLNSKTIRITIGDCRTWSIDKAQQKATEYKTLTDQGIDPRQLRADKIADNETLKAEEKRRNATFSEAWSVYIDANKSEWGDRHLADHINLAALGGADKKRGKGKTIDGPLASLLPLALTEFTGERLTLWLETETAKRPTSAALSYRLLRAFIRWSQDHKDYRGIIDQSAYSAKSVRRAIPRSKSKDDCLQREQLPIWFKKINELSNPVISTFLKGLLITGARREELGRLRWDDVDFKWKTMTIRDKVEGSRVIPLTPYFASLLTELKRLSLTPPTVRQIKRAEEKKSPRNPSQWVFTSPTSADGRLTDPRPSHVQALGLAGLPHLSLHGLRRSFGTLCEWVEVPSGISAQIMGHKPSAIAEKHYRKRPIDLLRMWHEKIEAWVLEQAEIDFKQQETSQTLRAVK